ncbi:Rho termination factor N-terminal domain-containing protein [Mucilaginibacter sp. UC70_90]
MSDKIELNDKLVSELREIARNLGIAEADELRKAQLVAVLLNNNSLLKPPGLNKI